MLLTPDAKRRRLPEESPDEGKYTRPPTAVHGEAVQLGVSPPSLSEGQLHKLSDQHVEVDKSPAEQSDIPLAKLSREQLDDIEKWKRMFRNDQGNPSQRVYDHVDRCVFCSRRRHTCRWEYRCVGDNENRIRRTAGGQCYACVRACYQLKCGRSARIIKKAKGVQAVLVARSADNARRLGELDFCYCQSCEQQRQIVPTVRLRQKTPCHA